jgi:carbon monoxide dehydrogenase subunit G
MAYLRNENQKIEIDYPIEKIWAAIPEAVKTLEWKIEEKNDEAHTAKLKTKMGFLSYSTIIVVEAAAVDEKKSCMTLKGETPVTTITAMADFGRTSDRIDQFIEAIAKLMEPEKKKKKPSKVTHESANA